MLTAVWPDLAKILKVIDNFLRVYLVYGILLNPVWKFLHAFGHISIDVNGQKLENILRSGHTVWRTDWLGSILQNQM